LSRSVTDETEFFGEMLGTVIAGNQSAGETASRLGVSTTTLKNWMSGRSLPRAGGPSGREEPAVMLALIADVTGTPVEYVRACWRKSLDQSFPRSGTASTVCAECAARGDAYRRTYSPSQAEVEAKREAEDRARGGSNAPRMREHIQKIVDAAPPLTEDQVIELGSILGSVTGRLAEERDESAREACTCALAEGKRKRRCQCATPTQECPVHQGSDLATRLHRARTGVA